MRIQLAMKMLSQTTLYKSSKAVVTQLQMNQPFSLEFCFFSVSCRDAYLFCICVSPFPFSLLIYANSMREKVCNARPTQVMKADYRSGCRYSLLRKRQASMIRLIQQTLWTLGVGVDIRELKGRRKAVDEHVSPHVMKLPSVKGRTKNVDTSSNEILADFIVVLTVYSRREHFLWTCIYGHWSQ